MHDLERAINRIAARQGNVIAREQLLAAGLGRGGISHRLGTGRIHRLHRGVYLIGPSPPTPTARAWAAVLACGGDGVVSHRSAAELYDLMPATGRDVDVTVVARNPHRQPGITIHRVANMPRHDVRTMRGLRITSVARTICDLAATEPPRECHAAVQEALYRRVVTDRSLAAVLADEPKRRGAGVIRELLRDPRLTRSERERLLLGLIERAQLPRPLTNVRLHGYLLDLYWPEEGLVVEFDGWGAHGHRLAFEADRKRDQVLLAAGLRVLRVTDRQLLNEPLAVAVRIGQALGPRRRARADAPRRSRASA